MKKLSTLFMVNLNHSRPLLPEMAQALRTPRPPRGHHSISPWIEEHIWGHRIWDGQSPWLLFLEFLTVTEACQREGKLLADGGAYPLEFRPLRRMFLRNILFNNDAILRFNPQDLSGTFGWGQWLEWMNDRAQAVSPSDFSYLKTRFPEFRDFALLVSMLRGATVESESNKRWTSRFIFPFGRNAIYEDVNIIKGSATREYIYFGRTGELLYLMLCRCQVSGALKPYLEGIIGSSNPWNRLLGSLQPHQEHDSDPRGRSYLPYREHPTFDALGEDWLAVFELGLSNHETFQHLVILGALHVLLYMLEVASEQTWPAVQPHFICEVVAPRKTLVREISADSYEQNNALPTRAVEAYLSRIIGTADWVAAENLSNQEEGFQRCRDILEREIWWGQHTNCAHTPAALIAELRDNASKSLRQHMGSVHRVYGREIGLVSRRGTNKLRYAPSDGLLKTLLLANVPRRMEFGEFLDRLYRRYGLVFGDREAAQVLVQREFDQEAFKSNTRRMEDRLRSLGMLRRLSDGCAYVQNPNQQVERS